MHRICLVLLLAVSALVTSCTTASRPAAGPLILISIDGYRWDYRQKYPTPALSQLAREGATARRMTASFPTKTFPNHYTLVTGLYPGNHGVVNNSFFDPALKQTFSPGRNEPVWWNGGEPIWVTAEKQGLITASHFWPGGDAQIRGIRPRFSQPFDRKRNTATRVGEALDWLGRPAEERPAFVAVYLDLVDQAAHSFGPESPEVRAAIAEVDAAIGDLLAGLNRLGLRETANLVIVSDHGMSEISPDRVVFYDDLVDLSQVSIESAGTIGGLRPKPGVDAASIVASIRARKPRHFTVYLREELPARYHYGRNERIPPIVFVMEDHWCIEQKAGWPNLRSRYNRGNHGWDPAYPTMGAAFIASGPAFRRGAEVDDVENVHLYNLLCRVLGIKPAPNDGDDRLAKAVLRR